MKNKKIIFFQIILSLLIVKCILTILLKVHCLYIIRTRGKSKLYLIILRIDLISNIRRSSSDLRSVLIHNYSLDNYYLVDKFDKRFTKQINNKNKIYFQFNC